MDLFLPMDYVDRLFGGAPRNQDPNRPKPPIAGMPIVG